MVVKSAITFIKHNMSNIWTVVLTVTTMLWCILAVTSQEQPAFSLAVPVNGLSVSFNFNDVMFHKFYHCLRNKNNDQCKIQRDLYNNVISVMGCLPVGSTDTTEELTCKSLTPGILCKRGSYSDENQIVRCPDAIFHDYEIGNDADLSSTARTTWLGFDNNIGMESHISGITVEGLPSPSQTYKFAITGTFTTTLPPPTPPPPTATTITTKATTATATTTTKSKTTATTPTTAATTPIASEKATTVASTAKTSKSISSGSPTIPATTTGSPGTSEHESDDDGDGDDNTNIIIGAAVGGAVVVAIIILIVVIFWKRKKKSMASPATTNNNQYEDTDIYPYGESTRPINHVNPNLNSNNLNHNPNQPTPDVYAIVDPSKKLNKTSSSDANNANSNNQRKPQEGRPYSNGSVDYTEVNIDNGAVYYQRSSDVNNDQGTPTSEIPPPPPSDPSAKLNHYVYPETGEDSNETYSQVVKKSKNEEESAFSGEGAGSRPADDPSGYEEAVPSGTDTQYTTVMDSSTKNTPKPAPDGVYAKLHDPVRNITDVYNEGPVEENTWE